MRQRQAIKAAARQWTAFESREVTDDLKTKFPFLKHCASIYVNSRFEVHCFECSSAIGGIVQCNIRRHGNLAEVTSGDVMRIKAELFGPDAVAMEIFPKPEHAWKSTSGLRVIWIMPSTYQMPIGLEMQNAWGAKQ